jgi:hypothetical protein
MSLIVDIPKRKEPILETLPKTVPIAFTFKIEHQVEVPEEGALQVNLLIHLHRQEEVLELRRRPQRLKLKVRVPRKLLLGCHILHQ